MLHTLYIFCEVVPIYLAASVNVLNTLFKKYEQAKNIEGIDTIELNNGVVVDVLESTSAGVMTIDGGGSSESAFTNIDGKEMKISIDAINKKGDVISVSSKLDATAKVEQGDVINNESLEVKVPFKPQKTDF